MANKEVLESGTGKYVTDSDGHEAEPGHQIAEQRKDEVFDPNAAWREKEGRGPGLQDSEALQPAVWVSLGSDVAVAQIDAEIARLEKQLDQLKADRKDAKGGGTVTAAPASVGSETKPVEPKQ